MRYFLDTEFIEKPSYLDLISIGIVAEDGRELYRENANVDWSQASQWVLDNVRPQLDWAVGGMQDEKYLGDLAAIRNHILQFVGDDPKPEFWGYYADYDWVLFCWLFGSMIDLPQGFPYFCRDLRQWLDENGHAEITQPDDHPHHALLDARWIAQTYRACARARQGEG